MAEISRTIKKEEEEMKQRRKRLMCLMLSAMLAVSTEAAALADEITVDTAVEDTVATQELPEESLEAEDAAPAEEDDLIAEPEDGSSETADGLEAGEGFEAEDTADTEDASSLTEFSGDGLIVGVEEVESPELAVYATSNSEEMPTEDGQFTYIVMTDDTTGAQTAAITGYVKEDSLSVQEITVPETIDGIPVTEIRCDFSNCSAVKTLNIPKYVTKLGSGVYALDGNSPRSYGSLSPVYAINPKTYTFTAYNVAAGNPVFSSLDGVLYNQDQTVLYRCPIGRTEITIPDTVKILYPYSFSGCKIVSPIVLTSDMKIGTKAFEYSYIANKPVLSFIIKKGNSENWENNYDCFSGIKITEFSIEDGIISFGAKDMFTNATIDVLRLPATLSSIKNDTFAYLKADDIHDLYYGGTEEAWAKVKSNTKFTDEMASNKHFESSYNIGDICEHKNMKTERKEATLTENGYIRKICLDCGYVYEDILPAIFGFVIRQDKDGNSYAELKTYNGTDNICSVPAEYQDVPVTQISSNVFLNKAIKQITLPNTITTIGMRAFSGCKHLAKINLPESITSIGVRAFDSCNSEVKFYYAGTSEEWSKVSIKSYNELVKTNVIFCDHSSTSVINKVDATCTTDGYTGEKQCDNCKKILEVGMVSKSQGHTTVIDAAVEPTCTADGLTEGSHCEVCDTVLVAQNVVPALGHEYVGDYTVEVEPTCTEDGLQSRHCTRCDEVEKQVIPALGHDYDEAYTTDVAPTCTTAGIQSRHCRRCGAVDETSKQEVAALGHDYVSKVTTASTCTKDGVQTDSCSRCGDVQTAVLKATGHQWRGWTRISDATVFAAEQQQRTCQTCGEKEMKAVGTALNPTATVNASTVTLKVKQSTKGLKVTDLAAGDSVASWKSTNTKVFTVKGNADGTCTLKGLKKGSAKLEITLASGMMKIVTVKVQSGAVKTTKVSVPAKKLTVQKGAKASLKPVVTPFTSLQKVTYTSSNKKVATVTKRGVITAKQAGTAKITIKSGSKKAVVTVTVPKTKTTGITVAKEVTVKKGKTYSLKAKVTPKNSDEKITYTSANKKIATVSKTGKIKGVKKGTTTITVKSGSQTVKVQVTVK